jgi:hypothetical protein
MARQRVIFPRISNTLVSLPRPFYLPISACSKDWHFHFTCTEVSSFFFFLPFSFWMLKISHFIFLQLLTFTSIIWSSENFIRPHLHMPSIPSQTKSSCRVFALTVELCDKVELSGCSKNHILMHAQSSGTGGSVVGWGTMLQAGTPPVRFPMRLLDYFLIYLILPAALWPYDRFSL